jgi:hypothetical protein
MERAWDSYVKPLLTHIEEELNVQLLEDFEGEKSDFFCKHDLSQVQALQEDVDAKATRLEGLYTSGIIMKSEARSSLNYGPSDPSNPDADKVWAIPTGINIVKLGEDPPVAGAGAQGAQVPGEIDPKTGKPVLPGAQPGAAPKPQIAKVSDIKTRTAGLALAKVINKKSLEDLQTSEITDVEDALRTLKRMRFEKAVSMIAKAG